MAASSDLGEKKTYRFEEFCNHAARLLYSEEFLEHCENRSALNIYQRRLALKIAHYRCHDDDYNVNEQKSLIIHEWNMLIFTSKCAKFGRQVFLDPLRSHLVHEMEHMQYDERNRYTVYDTTAEMMCLHQQIELFAKIHYEAIFFNKTTAHWQTIPNEIREFIKSLNRLPNYELTDKQIEMWYDPQKRKAIFDHWNAFTYKIGLEQKTIDFEKNRKEE